MIWDAPPKAHGGALYKLFARLGRLCKVREHGVLLTG